jgi:cell division protein FtsZ
LRRGLPSFRRCFVRPPAQAATSAPLIERSIERATGIVYNITGGKDLTLAEVNRVSEVVTSLADPSANVIFGAVIDDQYEGEIHVTIIATGFEQTFEENLLSGRLPAAATVRAGAGGAAAAAAAAAGGGWGGGGGGSLGEIAARREPAPRPEAPPAPRRRFPF